MIMKVKKYSALLSLLFSVETPRVFISGFFSGFFSSFFSGEGLVSRVKGPGKIYLQSRSIEGLAGWINRHL